LRSHIGQGLKNIISKIWYDYNIEIVELEIPGDHIHMVVSSDPKTCSSEIMQVIKSIAARNFFKMHPEIKKEIFLGMAVVDSKFFC
jgi:putative transposase